MTHDIGRIEDGYLRENWGELPALNSPLGEVARWPVEDSPTVWPVINHTRKHSHHVEIRRSAVSKRWYWQHRAGNGETISGSFPASYKHKRDLIRGLELAHPGFLMLDQDRGLTGPSWYLWSARLCYDDFLEAGKQATRFVEGVVIPVRVPEGTQWGSRVQR